MRIVGYCQRCHKVRNVNVSQSALMRWMARGQRGAVIGTCAQCEEEERNERRPPYRRPAL
ncbi:MAG TPA: hypothetical protein VIX41_11190 [Acidimicrobiales bacterium]